MKLEDGAWFVRSNGGRGSYPVTRQGWMLVLGYILGIVALAALSLWIALNNIGTTFLWVIVFSVGMAVDAFIFIRLAQSRTDFSVTYDEFKRRNA